MTWGIWNKIKKGFEKVKSKAIPAITKSVNFVKNNKDLIDAGIDFIAPKIGTSGNLAHGIVDKISRGPSMRELKLLHSNINDEDDEGYDESGGMIKPLYK